MYRTISNGHDQAQLQEDLQWLTDWEESWDMEFHSAKCQTPSITRSRKPLQPSYVLHGHTLENISSAKYLGVTINNTVSSDDYISNTCSKANRVLGFLLGPILAEKHCQEQSSPEASGTLHPELVYEHLECQQHAGGVGLAYAGAMMPDL